MTLTTDPADRTTTDAGADRAGAGGPSAARAAVVATRAPLPGPLPGPLTWRAVDPEADGDLLHAWLTAPRARFWMMQGLSREAVVAAHRAIDADPTHDALLGEVGGEPVVLVERYDPRGDAVGALYDVAPGDVGMHLFVGPATTPSAPPVPGWTTALMGEALALLFADPATARVVVEPDVENAAVQRVNARWGFVVEADVPLPGKTGRLSLLTRAAFEARTAPARWERADRELVAKALGEFAHELLVAPVARGDDRYEVAGGGARWTFSARRLPLDHWAVDPASVAVVRPGAADGRDGRAERPRALQLVLDLREQLGLSPEVLPVYLEEITACLAARASTLARGGSSVTELVDADFQALEAAMTAGHPVFVANNGRIGFDPDDYRAYAPEMGAPFALEWVAVRRDRSVFAAGAGTDEDAVYAAELDEGVRARFTTALAGLGLDPAGYRFVPVHPWQWQNRVAVTFAAELADRSIVHLGRDDDARRAQQSIRTVFDVSRPERSYVKTSLSVLNMGFLRGLSTEYMAVTPAINDWVHDLVADDEVLLAAGFAVLRERAAVGYRSPVFEAATQKGSPYRKMLAALWRESPLPRLAPGERLMTMAALLHRDDEGRSLAAALVAASGLPARTWLRRYLDAYLVPVLHLFFAHDLVFMPHGENLVLVLEDHAVSGAFLKDIGEEVALMSASAPLPAAVERIRVDVPEHLQLLSVQTDVFDCVFRQLGALLDEAGALRADDFWAEVAACATAYQDAHPELAGAFARHDLFAPAFARSCLNRLQLRDNRQMVDLDDPASALAIVGELDNPLAAHRRD